MTAGSFASNYERWILGRRRSRAIEAELSRTCRDGWQYGDEHDRYLALDFIFDKQDSAGFDIIIEGVDRNDWETASHAAIVASILLNRGAIQLTPSVRRVFSNFNRRFPEHAFHQFG